MHTHTDTHKILRCTEDFLGLFLIECHCCVDSNLHDNTKDHNLGLPAHTEKFVFIPIER